MSQQKDLKKKEAAMREIFQKLDTSGDGQLTLKELKSAFADTDKSDADLADMFRDVDTSGDKKVTCEEFVCEMCKKPRKDAFQEAFEGADCDGSGKLDRGEVKRLCQQVAPAGFTDEEIEQMIESVDKDHNGVIDINEFMALC